MSADHKPLHPEWRSHRRVRWRFGLLLFVLLVFPAIDPWLQEMGAGQVGVGLWLCLLAIWFVSLLQMAFFRCPRCGNSFYITLLSGNPFASRCVHCKLPKWTMMSPSEQFDLERAKSQEGALNSPDK